MEQERRVRDIAWDGIRRGGELVRKREPGLTPAQARQKFTRETDAGKKLLDIYNHADSGLTPTEFDAKVEQRAALERLGATSCDDLIAKLAKRVAKAEGLDHQDALNWVREHCPNVIKAYEQERRERAGV